MAASYLIGALGGIFYLRLLVRSVDSIGATTLGATAGGAAAQPRFLIPVILALFFNRCAFLVLPIQRSTECWRLYVDRVASSTRVFASP